MQQNLNWGQGQPTFDTKMRRKYPEILFCIRVELLRFRHTCHALSKFSSQIKLIQSVVRVSC